MLFNTAESVLIVEASNAGKFSKLLYNLIGTSDDKDDEPVGPVDGSIDASLFNEDQFAQTPLSSSQKVIFIGCPKGAGDYIEAIRSESENAVDEDGVYIGVSGKHVCITVSPEPPSKEGYWEFLARAKERGQDFDDLLTSLRPAEGSGPAEGSDKSGHSSDDNPLIGFVKMVGKVVADGAGSVNEAVVIRQKAAEIQEQRYRYAVKRFYREMLRDFAEA